MCNQYIKNSSQRGPPLSTDGLRTGEVEDWPRLHSITEIGNLTENNNRQNNIERGHTMKLQSAGAARPLEESVD